MSSGAVASSAEPKMKDSRATIAGTIRSGCQPAVASPSATASYIRSVRGEPATGSTATTGMSGACSANTSR